MSHFLGYAAHSFGFYDPNGESAQAGDIFWSMAGTYSATIFIVDTVEDIVATVLYAPMRAVGSQKALRIGLLWGLVSDAIG